MVVTTTSIIVAYHFLQFVYVQEASCIPATLSNVSHPPLKTVSWLPPPPFFKFYSTSKHVFRNKLMVIIIVMIMISADWLQTTETNCMELLNWMKTLTRVFNCGTLELCKDGLNKEYINGDGKGGGTQSVMCYYLLFICVSVFVSVCQCSNLKFMKLQTSSITHFFPFQPSLLIVCMPHSTRI